MTDFNLAEAFVLGELAAAQRFEGLKNTQELQDTVTEMFNGTINNINVTNVQGSPDEHSVLHPFLNREGCRKMLAPL